MLIGVIQNVDQVLRLISGESLQSTFEHHLLAIRQTDFTFDAETAFEYMPNNFNQMAGLVLYLNESIIFIVMLLGMRTRKMPTYDRIRKRSSTNRRLDDSTHRKEDF